MAGVVAGEMAVLDEPLLIVATRDEGDLLVKAHVARMRIAKGCDWIDRAMLTSVLWRSVDRRRLHCEETSKPVH